MTTPQRRIHVLPENIANKIAAGEVIQRPESVVKELLENSLDAGATFIEVIIQDGGKKLIQVVDDGSGMDEQDAVESFLRHATSKIASYEDLEAIRTYGFRGEALASIAAVAHVTMKTRRRDEDAALVVQVDGGGVSKVSREGRVPGTTLLVRNLFFNVPARRKFLKGSNTEFRHIYDAVQRIAISHPEIGIRFTSDDETILDLKPGSLEIRLLDIFGARQFESLLPVHEEAEHGKLSGYVGKPTFGQKTRANQFLFLNKRYIVSRNISHAVFTAYEHLMIKGAFPFFILFLDIDPGSVDVNVHPSKLEAKFEDEQGIHRFVSAAVRNALASHDFVPTASLLSQGDEGVLLGLRFTNRQHAWSDRPPGNESSLHHAIVDTRTGEIVKPLPGGGTGAAHDLLRPRSSSQNEGSAVEGMFPEAERFPVWQLDSKYILTHSGGSLTIVDQHVAHERVLYERIMKRFDQEKPSTQQLLFPQTVQLQPADYALVEELFPHLEKIGFAIRPFGKNTVVLDGVPADISIGDSATTIEEVLQLYREYQQYAPLEVRETLAKSLSCKAAVKAGDTLSQTEMRGLLDQLSTATMPYVCPHGRPVLLKLSIDELDRRFGRT